MYPPPPHVVRCGFLTNPPSPPVRPRGLRMAPYSIENQPKVFEEILKWPLEKCIKLPNLQAVDYNLKGYGVAYIFDALAVWYFIHIL